MTVTKVVAAMALAMTLTAVPTAMAISADVMSAPQAQGATSKLKGTIKSLDTAAVTVVPADNKGTEVVFEVTSATTKSGALESGASVEVTYRFSGAKRVATALTGKAAK